MRYIIAVIISLFVLQPVSGQRKLWTVGTANTLGRKDIRLSVFQESGYGLTNTLELSAHALFLPVAPNLAIKKTWYSKRHLSVASKHGAHYPSWVLRNKYIVDNFAWSPKQMTFPDILSLKNEVYVSYGFGEVICPSFTREEFNRENTFKGYTTILTLKLGLQNGLMLNDSLSPLLTDKFIFHHTYHYFDNFMAYIGFDVDGRILRDVDYSADMELVFLSDSYWAVEHKALIKWETGRRFLNFVIGYQASYGSYPSGNRFFIGPFIDLMWIMRRDKIDYGLFGKKMF